MHIHRAGETKPPAFDTLTVQEFVVGFMCDIDKCKDEHKKKRLWLHLHQLMTDAMHFGWESIRGFHAVFLQQIEQGRMDWDSDISSLKTQYLLAPLGKLSDKQAEPRRNQEVPRDRERDREYGEHPTTGPVICLPYQSGGCKAIGDQHESTRGTVRHICAFCLKATGRFCHHPEDKCIRKTKTGEDQ